MKAYEYSCMISFFMFVIIQAFRALNYLNALDKTPLERLGSCMVTRIFVAAIYVC